MKRLLVSFAVAALGVAVAAIDAGCGASLAGDGASDLGGGELDGGGDGASLGPVVDADTHADGALPEAVVACASHGSCTISQPGCCGITCDPEALVAIASGTEELLRKATCDADGGVACPGCEMRVDENVQGWCIAGRCQKIDVRTESVSACATDDDCRLRYPGCCECGQTGPYLVAIAKSAESAYEQEVCAPSAACADCVPSYPTSRVATCNRSTHHCEVTARD
jgi:hypothetical protein